MRKVCIAVVFVCLFSVPLLAQDSNQELAEKLDKVDRAAAMKMFPGLEKLRGFESRPLRLCGRDMWTALPYVFVLPYNLPAHHFYVIITV